MTLTRLAATLLATLSLTVSPLLHANDFAAAKKIIADIERIVTPDGVEEMFTAKIGGIDQWLSVRSNNRDNPVLLFVHGGPAGPAMPWAWTFQRPWEEYFTVVQWDQRAAGKTYLANDPDEVAPTIHIDRYVDDTLEVIELLRERYGKRKIVLVGHSWGTIIGLRAAIEKPEWIHAYVGIGQVIAVNESERISYEFALESAQREGNEEAVRELEALAPYPGDEPLTRDAIVTQRKWVQHYWGLSAYRNDSAYYFNAQKLSPAYSKEDLAAVNQGSLLTLDRIMQEWASVDYRDIREVDFPVVMLMGRYDQFTPSELTAQWMERLDAPVKHAVWFEDSSHLVPIEEPGKTLITLVNLVLPLAKNER